MSLLKVSAKSHIIIFKILQSLYFPSTDQLRFTNSKVNNLASKIEENGKPLKMKNVHLSIQKSEKICRSHKCQIFEAIVIAMHKTYRKALLHEHMGTFKVQMVRNNPSVDQLHSIFNRVMQRVCSIEDLSFYEFPLYDEHLMVFKKWKNELKSVKEFNITDCKIYMNEESLTSLLKITSPRLFDFTSSRFLSTPAVSGSILRNIKILSNRVSYSEPIGIKLDDSLIYQWCENPPTSVSIQHLKTDFTLPAVIKLLEILSNQKKHQHRFIGIGVGLIDENQFRDLLDLQRRTRGIRWYLTQRASSYWTELNVKADYGSGSIQFDAIRSPKTELKTL